MSADVPLSNFIANDGSRHFVSLPQTQSWNALRSHIQRLGAKETGFTTDGVTEGWLDFSFEGERFTVNDQLGEFWFFANNPRCDEQVLQKVASHCANLLGNAT